MITDLFGIAAGVFVILAFDARRARHLRIFAILSNLLFVAYALLAALMPVLILHAILLPLNVARLRQIEMRRQGADQGADPPGQPGE